MNRILLLLAMVCAGQSAFAAKPNILWITAENMGPDLGCYPDSPYSKQVSTPNIDKLASEGLRYRLAFDTSPGCSPSRSAFMTGMYQTTIGAHNHRSHRHDHFQLPDGVRPLTHRLIEAGYFTANVMRMDKKMIGTGKTDLNFEVNGPVLNSTIQIKPSPAVLSIDDKGHNDRNSARLYHSSEWGDLKAHQPFFAQINLPVIERTTKNGVSGFVGSEEMPAFNGQVHPKLTDPDTITPPPYYPDHPITRKDWAAYLDAVHDVDTRVGDILARLAADGLADNTIVIFFADNGRLEARGHHWCYDSGERVPLIVRWPASHPAPSGYHAGAVSERLISLLDLTATTLAFAGVKKPIGMQSEVFLGPHASPPRKYAFSARDRCDDVPQRIRSVRSARYRYIRNFMPEIPFRHPSAYKDRSYPVMALMRQLHAQGKLTPPQATLMAPRLPDEELYDLENDPFEIHNLATDPQHESLRQEMSAALDAWIESSNDQGRTPEPPEILEQWREWVTERFSKPKLPQ